MKPKTQGKTKKMFYVGRTALTNMTEAFYEVVQKTGQRRDPESDWLIALCFRKCDAERVKRALKAEPSRK